MSDSVGKITLDLELKSDLESQINKISQQIGEKLKASVNEATKGMFDGMNENMNKSMQSMTDTLKSNLGKMKDSVKSSFSNIFSAAKNIKAPTGKKPSNENEQTPVTSNVKGTPVTRPPPKFDIEKIKAQQEDAERVLETTNKQIEAQYKKLDDLNERYERAFSVKAVKKLEQDLLVAEARLNSLLGKSDRYGFKLADLDAKLAEFALEEERAAMASQTLDTELAETGVVAQETGSKISRLSTLTRAFTSGMNSSFGAMKKFGNQFSDLGSKVKNCDKQTRNYHYGLGMIMRQFFTWMIVLPALMRAINYLTLGLWNNLKTNEQFNNSLEQIKTNLMVAFTPIYQAILPAINAFMSALATLTTYIASFMSVIFGKTYQQSYQATQGLIDAKEAMGAYGDAAKKTAKELGGLVGIDEINNLTKSDAGAADNSKVPKLTQPSLDTSETDAKMQALADKIKKMFADIFAPMKQAWDAQGKATIEAFKTMLSDIWRLIKDIGKSYFDVWTNGTGERVMEHLLILLQTIFGIIGDIAKAFAIAWETNGLGTAVVQAMFDAFDSILRVLITIGKTFREVWNNGTGVAICTLILQIIKNIFDAVTGISDAFIEAWNSNDVGKTLIQTILDLIKNMLTIIQELGKSFLDVWNNGTGVSICSNILQILTNIVGTVTDLAGNFAKAWETGNVGTQIFQGIGDTINALLTIISHISQSVREAFNSPEVQSALQVFMQALNATIQVLQNVAEKLIYVWDNGGSHLFEGIVKLGAKILEIAGIIYNSFVAPLISWFIDQIVPAIANVMDAVGFLLDAVIKICDFLTTTGKGAIELICASLKHALEDFLRPIFEFLTDETAALELMLQGLSDFVAGVFTGNWSQAWNGIKEIFRGVFDSLVGIAKPPINGIIRLINGLIDSVNVAIRALNSIEIEVPDWVPGIGGESWGFNLSTLGHVPYLAKGGVIDSPTLAMVGEAGKEAVMPLENNTGWISELASKIASLIGVNSNSVSTSPNDSGDLIIMIDGDVIGKVALAQLRKMQRQGSITLMPV